MRWLAAVVAMAVAMTVFADIRTTPHSLRKGGEALDPKEVCVFCHTPTLNIPEDGLLQRVVPIWQQRSIPDNHTFTIYDDIGRLEYGDKPVVGSQSIACLSCHDSTQAFSVTRSSYDHPYGVPYRGYSRHHTASEPQRPANDEAPAMLARYLKAMEDFREPSNAVVDNRRVWWVSTTGNQAVRSRSDLPLYVREDEASGNEVPFIECGSCHDPHSNNRLFLRVTDRGSKLCLACHDK